MASQAEGRYWKSGWAWWHQQTHRDRIHWFSKGWRCKVKKNWNVDPKLRSSQENRQSKTAEDGVDSGFGAAAELALYWDSLCPSEQFDTGIENRHRSMEQTRQPRNKLTHLRSPKRTKNIQWRSTWISLNRACHSRLTSSLPINMDELMPV